MLLCAHAAQLLIISFVTVARTNPLSLCGQGCFAWSMLHSNHNSFSTCFPSETRRRIARAHIHIIQCGRPAGCFLMMVVRVQDKVPGGRYEFLWASDAKLTFIYTGIDRLFLDTGHPLLCNRRPRRFNSIVSRGSN